MNPDPATAAAAHVTDPTAGTYLNSTLPTQTGALLWFDRSGNKIEQTWADNQRPGWVKLPSLIPVNRSHLVPYVRNFDTYVAGSGGHDSLYLNHTRGAVDFATNGTLDSYFAPADQYSANGEALFHDGASSPDIKLYFGGEAVLDAQGNPAVHAAGDPVYDLFNSTRLFALSTLGASAALHLASAQDPWGTGQSLTIRADSFVAVTLFDTQRAYTLHSNEFTVDVATNTVTLNPSAATGLLFSGALQAEVIVLNAIRDAAGAPITHAAGDPVQHLRYDPVLHSAGDPARYLGNEPFLEEPRLGPLLEPSAPAPISRSQILQSAPAMCSRSSCARAKRR